LLNNLNTNAQQQQQFIFQLTQLIKSEEAYGSGVELLTYKIKDNNDIEGKFRDSWNNRIFSFLINRNQLGYKPAIKLDSSHNVDSAEVARRFDTFTIGYLNGFRIDAKRPRQKRTEKSKCTHISYSCGTACIPLLNNCWIDGTGKRVKTAGDAVKNIVQERIDKLRGLAELLKSQPENQAWAKYGTAKSLETKGRQLDEVSGRVPVRLKGIAEVDPNTISVDPKRFQYKIIGELTKTGNVGSLGGVKKWDENLAGIIQVWEDPADKKVYVVNGHNRLDLAKKLGAEQVTIRYLQANSAKEARGIGALTNIAEGMGTALDAGKFFRDSGLNKDDLDAKGIPMRESIANNGLALANLSDSLFSRVILGSLSESRGIAISKIVTDLPPSEIAYQRQEELLQMIEEREKKGKNITNEVIEELAVVLQNAPTHQEEQGGLLGLLGYTPQTRSLAIERATLQAGIKKRLSQEAKLFGTVGKSKAAQQLEKAGNLINVEESSQTSVTASKALRSFGEEAKLVGSVSNLLNAAATKMADGTLSKQGEDKLYDEILASLRKTYFF
jgi:hypothetical protein